jgi:hypothetical protein
MNTRILNYLILILATLGLHLQAWGHADITAQDRVKSYIVDIAKRYHIPYSIKTRPDGSTIPMLLVNSAASRALTHFLNNSVGTQSLLLPDYISDHGQFRFREMIIDLADPGTRPVGEIHSTGISWRKLPDYLSFRNSKSNALVETAYFLTKSELETANYYHRIRRAAIFRAPFALNGRRILFLDQPNSLETTASNEHCFAYSKGSSLSQQIVEIETRLAQFKIKNVAEFMKRPAVQSFLIESKKNLMAADPFDRSAMHPEMNSPYLNADVGSSELGNWILAWDAAKQYLKLIRNLNFSPSVDAPGDFNNNRATAILVYDSEAQAEPIRKGTYQIKGSDNLILKIKPTVKSQPGIPTINPSTAFPESTYGLSDSVRRGHSHFAEWAANLTTDLLKSIQTEQVQPEVLFLNAMKARVQFAKDQEGIENPAKDGFGEPRVKVSQREQGEERVGISSIGLDLKPTTRPPLDYEYPEEIWKKVSKINSRTETANFVLRAAAQNNVLEISPNQNELVVDRFYQTLDGQQIKLSGTKFRPLAGGDKNPSYMVGLLNAPKSNVDTLMKDIYERIAIVLKSKENTESNREHLIRAMQGFYCAMPYYRGTAAVGRVVFTALFSSLSGTQVTLHPEVDIKALSLEYSEFKAASLVGR